MQPVICQHREQHISKRNYEITVVQEILFPDYKYKDDPSNLLYPFLQCIFGIRERGLATPFGIV